MRPNSIRLRRAGILFPLIAILSIAGEPTPPLTLLLGGDVMLGRGVSEYLQGDWKAAFGRIAPLLAGDALVFANLESPLTDAPQQAGSYDLRAAPAAAAALRVASFDLLSLANNHVLDAGPAGLAQTRQTLAVAGVQAVGDGETACGPGWCLLALYSALADPAAAQRAVAAAAAPGRLLIVSLHWGGEYQAAPSVAQQALAAKLAAAGADLIVGHGPHVLQRVEWLDDTLVAYSLGNLLFDQPYPVDCRQGALLRVTVRGTQIVAVDAIPTIAERGHVRLASAVEAVPILERLAGNRLACFERPTAP